MAGEIDIEVPRNGSYFGEWRLADNVGSAIDLTGHTITMQARQAAGAGSVLASATVAIVEASDGRFTVRWDGSDFDAVDGESEIVRLAYDLKHTSGGVTEIPIRGQLILMPEVTP